MRFACVTPALRATKPFSNPAQKTLAFFFSLAGNYTEREDNSCMLTCGWWALQTKSNLEGVAQDSETTTHWESVMSKH